MKKFIHFLLVVLLLTPLTFCAVTDDDTSPLAHRLSSTYTVFVTLEPKPERKEELMQMLLRIQHKSLVEEPQWCTGFKIFLLSDNRIFLVENWTSKEALENHREQDYMKEVFKEVPALLVGGINLFDGVEVLSALGES